MVGHVAVAVRVLHKKASLHWSAKVAVFLPRWRLKQAGMDDGPCHIPQASSCLVWHGGLQHEMQYRNTIYHMHEFALILECTYNNCQQMDLNIN